MVTSSIIVFSDLSSSFIEVSTKKQIPSKLEDAFKICGDFLFCWFIHFLLRKDNYPRLRAKFLNKRLNTVSDLLFRNPAPALMPLSAPLPQSPSPNFRRRHWRAFDSLVYIVHLISFVQSAGWQMLSANRLPGIACMR